jgi:hypothetical protein
MAGPKNQVVKAAQTAVARRYWNILCLFLIIDGLVKKSATKAADVHPQAFFTNQVLNTLDLFAK